MNIKKLQRQAAASTDELLAVSEDIGRYVIAAYGSVSGEMFAMQCKMQLARCRRLIEKMRQTDAALAAIAPGSGENNFFVPEADKNGGGRAAYAASASGRDRVSREQAESLALTRRLLAQNLLLAGQKEHLLKDFLTHSDSIRSRLKDARDMEDRAEILRLQNTLRRELSPCRNEKENGN